MSDQTPENPQVQPIVQTLQGPQDLSADTGGGPTSPAAVPATAPAAPAPATTSAAAPAAAPTPGTQAAADQHHGILGEIFQTLAGGKKKEWVVPADGGAPVATYRDLKPGEMARGILAAAITGLAGGYDPANRGKGPAMASAFAGGFKANEQRVEKKQGQEEKEAQEQFKNQNISEEMAFRKQKNARDQQESLLNMAKTQHEINGMIDRSSREKIIFTQEQQEYLNKQFAEIDRLKDLSFKPIPDPNNPGQNYGFKTHQEAMDAARKDPNVLLRPGDYDTRAPFDPTTGMYVPMVQEIGFKDKVDMRFAERDAKGNVKKDKNGDPIPDGQRGLDGEVLKPRLMKGSDYESYKNEIADYNEKLSKTRLGNAQAAELHEKQQMQKDVKHLGELMYASGNDPWAVDPKTLLPYMNDGQRSQLASTSAALNATSYNDISKINTALQTASDPTVIATLHQELDEAIQINHNSQATLNLMKGRLNKSQALAKAFVTTHVDTNGKVDEKAALEDFDKQTKDPKKMTYYNGTEVANAREYLRKQIAEANKSAETAAAQEQTEKQDYGTVAGSNQLVNTPLKLDAAKTTMQNSIKSGMSIEAIQADIRGNAALGKDDKKALFSALPKPVPGKVMLYNTQTGEISFVDPKDVGTATGTGTSNAVVGEKPAEGALYELNSPKMVQVPGTTPGTR